MIRFIEWTVVAAVLTFGGWLLTWNLTAPINGWHEWNTAMYGIHARNHIAWGLGVTKGLCTWGETASPPPQPDYYLNHPPLISLWAAGSILLFGDNEAALRIVPIAATLGSALLLWRMGRRAGNRLLGILLAYCFVLLPVTAYFGRMLDHVAPVQFFSLLMLHGYLLWIGWYPTSSQPAATQDARVAASGADATLWRSDPQARLMERRLGIALYLLGVTLGIGTGWAAVLMAGLLAAFDAAGYVRTRRNIARLCVTFAAPAIVVGAVLLQIAWARGWDFSLFVPMFLSRALGNARLETPGLAGWLARQGDYGVANFTSFGAVAAALYVVAGAIAAFVAVRNRRDARAGRSARRWSAAANTWDALGSLRPTFLVPIALCALQGLAYVLIFRERAFRHDYWQIFLAPFVAAALAASIYAAAALLQGAMVRRAPRVATVVARAVAVALAAIPAPAALERLRYDHSFIRQIPEHYIDAYRAVAGLIPPRAPLLVSRDWPFDTEQFGTYTNRWRMPVIAYYANRPLIAAHSADEVRAHRGEAAAYLHELRPDDLRDASLIAALRQEFRAVPVGRRHIIFLWDK